MAANTRETTSPIAELALLGLIRYVRILDPQAKERRSGMPVAVGRSGLAAQCRELALESCSLEHVGIDDVLRDASVLNRQGGSDARAVVIAPQLLRHRDGVGRDDDVVEFQQRFGGGDRLVAKDV